MLTYTYAVVGMEIFNSTLLVQPRSPYIQVYYSSFDDVGGAFLNLFDIINQNG